jgi:hypothetical protein
MENEEYFYKECPRCDNKQLKNIDFPPHRRICRSCYTLQVAACHRRAAYKPPRATIHQIRVWRILTQLRRDAALKLFSYGKCPPITSRQVSAILLKAGVDGRGVALMPSVVVVHHATLTFDFRDPNKLRLVSLDQRRSLLHCSSPLAYEMSMSSF